MTVDSASSSNIHRRWYLPGLIPPNGFHDFYKNISFDYLAKVGDVVTTGMVAVLDEDNDDRNNLIEDNVLVESLPDIVVPEFPETVSQFRPAL